MVPVILSQRGPLYESGRGPLYSVGGAHYMTLGRFHYTQWVGAVICMICLVCDIWGNSLSFVLTIFSLCFRYFRYKREKLGVLALHTRFVLDLMITLILCFFDTIVTFGIFC